jgi:hypothetical protein
MVVSTPLHVDAYGDIINKYSLYAGIGKIDHGYYEL